MADGFKSALDILVWCIFLFGKEIVNLIIRIMKIEDYENLWLKTMGKLPA